MPAGIFQNAAESGVAFVRNQVIMQTIGPEGLGYLPYLTALFFFIFFSNITEIIPGRAVPGQRPVRCAARARAAHVAHLQRGGRREAGPVPLPEELDDPARRARWRSFRSS